MNSTDSTLHVIGDVARRTGLSVSAIRYYSDEGLVRPTDETDGGHRLYDLEAIARLELVRTLRDLDTGLEQIRRVLTGAVSLPDLLAEHLHIVEDRTGELQAKRAVLRALVRKEATPDRMRLLQRLVTMPDLDRQRAIDEFWDSVSGDLPREVIDRIQGARPELPQDPSPTQLDAWLTLSELLQDEQFRAGTRVYLRETYASEVGVLMSREQVQHFIHSSGKDVMTRLGAVHGAGIAAGDELATRLADEFVRQTAAAVGVAADDDLRRRLAARYRDIESVVTQTLEDEEYHASHGRYLELVAVINGEPHPDEGLARLVRDGGHDHGPNLSQFGPWVADAILGTVAVPS